MLKRTGLAVLIIIFLVGCREKTQSTRGERYIITSPEVAEMFTLVAGTGNIVGLTTECNYPASLSAIEKIGTFGKVDFEHIKNKIHLNEGLMAFFNKENSKDNIRDKFNDELDNLLLDFVNTKLELYNKLSEDRVNATLKRVWFNELYDTKVRGIAI